MEGPQFRQELSQQLKLCPQLMQNIALLQMNVQDLREFLERAVEENPMLEQQEPSGDAFRELSARNEWMRTSSDAPPEPGAEDRELTSRESFLRDQLARRKLPPKLLSLCTYLIELLDEDGFLPPEELEHLHHLGLPDPMLEEALAAVQALEPAGIAARSLSECLLIQLRAAGRKRLCSPSLSPIISRPSPGSSTARWHICFIAPRQKWKMRQLRSHRWTRTPDDGMLRFLSRCSISSRMLMCWMKTEHFP